MLGAFSRGLKIQLFGVGLMVLGWKLPDLVEKYFPGYLELLKNVTILDGDFFAFSKIVLLISGAILILIGGRMAARHRKQKENNSDGENRL